jgi:hypothetical protein
MSCVARHSLMPGAMEKRLRRGRVPPVPREAGGGASAVGDRRVPVPVPVPVPGKGKGM